MDERTTEQRREKEPENGRQIKVGKRDMQMQSARLRRISQSDRVGVGNIRWQNKRESK